MADFQSIQVFMVSPPGSHSVQYPEKRPLRPYSSWLLLVVFRWSYCVRNRNVPSSDGVTVFETVMSQVKGLGLPKEQPRVGMF